MSSLDLYRFGFNGMERDDDIQGSGSALDFGARIYDCRLGRFLSVDPAFKEFVSMSTYVGLGNNPIYFVDLDVEKIVVPDPDQRPAVLKMINSKAVGLYAFDKNGELYQKRATGDDTKYSQYYSDRLNQAIKEDKSIEVRIRNKFSEPIQSTSFVDDEVIKELDHQEFDSEDSGNKIDLNTYEYGGGLTINEEGDVQNVLVYVSKIGNNLAKDQDGNRLYMDQADILLHELLAHAIPAVAGSDTGDGVKNENKAKAQTGATLREEIPHPEFKKND